MKTFLFTQPSGREQRLTATEVLDCIRVKRDDFWLTGSYTGSIVDDDTGNWLTLMAAAGRYYVMFTPRSGEDEFILVDASRRALDSGGAILKPGGEPMEVPPEQMVDQKLAYSVIRVFLESGEKDSSQEWVVLC